MKSKNIFKTSVAIALAFVWTTATSAEETLTVVSFGGSYAQACVDGYHKAFEEETGIKIKLEDYNGGLAQVRAQVDAGSVHWDVVDTESSPLMIGCDEGVFEEIPDIELPPAPDGTPAADDFFDGMLFDCGVGTLVFATVLVYNSENIEGDPPASVKDFFDLEKFPGRRGMRRSPSGNLEWALMADGVPNDEIFDTLATEEGLQRAFRKLDTIKEHVIWWETGAQAPQLLADGEVVMTTAWNGRIFNAQVVEKQPFVIIWDGHMRDYGAMAIVAGAPNLENAKKFVAFATSTRGMVGVANHISYAPVRDSGLPLVGKHATTGEDMKPHMPTYPANSKNFLWYDVEFWTEHEDELIERFNAWLAR
ncbi:MAG: ABC transporter substrate-binding protein [Gammaproteobacteria bacterium]|nr:ABC transporter substrate-binding protein [Gammaproteobacteria bacterium]